MQLKLAQFSGSSRETGGGSAAGAVRRAGERWENSPPRREGGKRASEGQPRPMPAPLRPRATCRARPEEKAAFLRSDRQSPAELSRSAFRRRGKAPLGCESRPVPLSPSFPLPGHRAFQAPSLERRRLGVMGIVVRHAGSGQLAWSFLPGYGPNFRAPPGHRPHWEPNRSCLGRAAGAPQP